MTVISIIKNNKHSGHRIKIIKEQLQHNKNSQLNKIRKTFSEKSIFSIAIHLTVMWACLFGVKPQVVHLKH